MQSLNPLPVVEWPVAALPDGESSLRIVRLPGAYGPTLLLRGRLGESSADLFRRQALVLAALRHRAIVLRLDGLDTVEPQALSAVRDACFLWQQQGMRTVLVTDSGLEPLVLAAKLSRCALVVRSERDALDWLRRIEGRRRTPVRSWEQALRESLEWWRRFARDLDTQPSVHAARRLLDLHPLCERSEAAASAESHGSLRCHACPLYHALGGGETSLGCGSLVDPILEELSQDDLEGARRGVERVVRRVREVLDARVGAPPAQPSPSADSAGGPLRGAVRLSTTREDSAPGQAEVHRAQQRVKRALRSLWRASTDASRARFLEALEHFRTVVEAQFRTEETTGPLVPGAVQARGEAAMSRLREDHMQLREELASLTLAAPLSIGDPDRIAAIGRHLQALLRQLRRHELQEGGILLELSLASGQGPQRRTSET